MSDNITVPKGDFGFKFSFTVQNADRSIFVLTGYTITFNVWTAGAPGSLHVSGSTTIDVAASGTCYYTVVDGDFDTVGSFKWELELTKAGVNESTIAGNLTVTESG